MKKTQKGITLIALIITIVVLMILAVVTINSVKDGGIITHAQNAASEYTVANEKEQLQLAYAEYQLAKASGQADVAPIIEGATVQGDKDTGWTVTFNKTGNTYDLSADGSTESYPTSWEYAWVKINGEWDPVPLKAGDTIPENTIVAKFYKTDAQVDPPKITISVQGASQDHDLLPGNAYKLVIEGNGEIGDLITTNAAGDFNGGFFGWQTQIYDYMLDNTKIPITPYVTDVTIGEGITSIGYSNFYAFMSLKNVKLPKSLTSIGTAAFQPCKLLTNITLPENLTSIGDYAFAYCDSLTNITLPENLTSIGYSAFRSCDSLTSITLPENLTSIGDDAFLSAIKLENIYVETTKLNAENTGDFAFWDIKQGATFYVRNDDMYNLFRGLEYNNNITFSTNYNW